MLNKVIEFAGTSLGKKVIIGSLALVAGAVGIGAIAKKPNQAVPVNADGSIEVEGEIVNEETTDEETSTDEQ